MSKTVKLYHVSQANYEQAEDIRKNGLSPKHWGTAIGGQSPGFYFFTREMWAQRWVERNPLQDYGYMCSTVVPKESIRFPNWQLDLFFNQAIIDKMGPALKKLYAGQIDQNGFLPLKLQSKTATADGVGYDCFFSESPVEIDGLRWKGNRCTVLYHNVPDPDTHAQMVELSSTMKEGCLGIADTLARHLCEKDANFMDYYNKKLQQNVSDGLCFGAVKCVVPKNMPVSVKPIENHIGTDLLLIWAKLIAMRSELKNIPVHKRIGEGVRNFIADFRGY